MAMTINTNISSINAQRNLSASGGSLATSMQRISSGLRVNSAKDDAAGLAISERMNAQVKGLAVASRNANDGISLAQTAEGALGKVGDMRGRMRDLAVQASNATNSDSDRKALQAEVTQLTNEIDRVAKQSNFNGQKILDGSFAGGLFQVGANSGDNITVGGLTNAAAAGLSNISYASKSFTVSTQIASQQITNSYDADGKLTATVGAGGKTEAIAGYDKEIKAGTLKMTVGNGEAIDLGAIGAANSSLDRLGQVVSAINNKSSDTGVTAFMTKVEGTDNYSISLMSSKLDTDGKPETVKLEGFTSATTGISSGGETATDLTALTTAATAAATALTGATEPTWATATQTEKDTYNALVTAKAEADLAVANATARNTLATGAKDASIVAADGKQSQRGIDDISVTTQADAWVAIKQVDSAVDQVNSARAELGALQTRFESAVSNIDIQTENLSAARGRIVDADFAKETANLSRTQILQQAGTAMVAQAIQLPQQVLSLLR